MRKSCILIILAFVCFLQSNIALYASDFTLINYEYNFDLFTSPPPEIIELKPDRISLKWPLYEHFNLTTHYQVLLNHTFYNSSTQENHDTLINLTPGAKYKIAVVTFHDGFAINVSSSTQIIMPPPAPLHITPFDIASTTFKLFWQKVDTATAYRIYTCIGDFIKEIPATETKAELADLSPGSQFCLYMTALNESGESYPSAPLVVQLAPPPPILALLKDGIGSTWCKLTWLPVKNALNYYLYLNGAIVEVLPSTNTSYMLEDLDAGTVISVQIAVENSSGASELSEPILIELIPPPPRLVVTEVSSISSTLLWSVSNGATYYKIYLDGEWAIFNVPATINQVTLTENIYEGMIASYTVVAGNASGESEHSNYVEVVYVDGRTGFIDNNNDLALMSDSDTLFSVSSKKFYKNPTICVIFPEKLKASRLAIEASYLDDLASMPALEKVNFFAFFLGEKAEIENLKSANITWRQIQQNSFYRCEGTLPIVGFYSSGGHLLEAIRISIPILTTEMVINYLPEIIEIYEGYIDLYSEQKTLFDSLHQNY